MSKLLMLLFSVCILGSCDQAQTPVANTVYTFDPSIKQQVDQKVKSKQGINMSAMDFILYKDDKVYLDSYTKGRTIEDCLMMATLEGDTINIFSLAGMFAGFGYEIRLLKDSAIVHHFAKSDVEIYKLNKNDSLSFGVTVPCKFYKLTLAKKPEFKEGEIVEGVIELVSGDYYEVAGGEERKYSMKITGYFRTDSIFKPGPRGLSREEE